MADPREHPRARDFVAIKMQDRQHRTVASGIEEFVRMPTRCQRTGFGFAIANDAGDNQIGIIKRRAISVRQRITQFAAFVNRAGRFRRNVTRNAAGERRIV